MRGKAQYLTLDAMRGIAAISVIWFHLHFILGYDSAGCLAVDFFFVLSGFVIAFAYDQRLDTGLSVGSFVKARLIRMYPLFIVGLVLGLVVQELLILKGFSKLSQGDTLGSFFVEAFWIPSPFYGSWDLTFPINGPSWSLSFEILANLLFAIFHRHLSNRLLTAIVLISGAVVVATVIDLGTINTGWEWSNIELGLARVMFSFPLGVLLYRYREHIPASLGRVPPWALLAALGLILVLPEWRITDVAFLLIGGPLLVAAGFRAGIGSKTSNAFRLLGNVSYPVYALHGPPIILLQGATKILHLGQFGLVISLLYIAGVLVVAHLIAPVDARFRKKLAARFLDSEPSGFQVPLFRRLLGQPHSHP
jgi:peptidoglycan/LPS O-acetylase OafA/YrhL